MKIGIYGLGLMGGSLALALKKKGHTITGLGRNPEKLKILKTKKIIDSYVIDRDLGRVPTLAKGEKGGFGAKPDNTTIDVEIIFICLPVKETIPGLKRIYNHVPEDTLFCDIASVKEKIIIEAERFIAAQKVKRSFIGLHPMAGNEKAGFENAVPGLYTGAACIVVRSRYSPPDKLKRIKALLAGLSMRVFETTGKRHDAMVGVVSHIPHIVSFGYAEFFRAERKKERLLPAITAGSFRDLTRISSRPSENWADIIYENRKNIRPELAKLLRVYQKLLSAIENPVQLKSIIRNLGKT